VVALGKTIEEAMNKCLEYASQIEGDDVKYGKDIAKKTKEAIENGKKVGIKF
jgi:phosphoribosylamine-glycine ligase